MSDNSKVIPFPVDGPDFVEMEIDGKPEVMLSARGVVLFCLSSWKLDGTQRAREGLRRYCEYICLHGYQGGASAAFNELDALDKDGAIGWIKRTYSRYVNDGAALVRYVMEVPV